MMERANTLLDEEKEWYYSLETATREAGIKVPNKFLLAAWAIQSKGDLKKALKRIEQYNRMVAKYNLDSISDKEATEWFLKRWPDNPFVCQSKEGDLYFGGNRKMIDWGALTEKEWPYMMKHVLMNLQLATPTLQHLREGQGIMINLDGTSMLHFSNKAEKRKNELSECFPIRVKEVLIVNPPSFLPAVLAMARMIFSSKMLQRVKPVKTEKLLEMFEASHLPPSLGGTGTLDFWKIRTLRTQQFNNSVKEMQAPF